MQAENKVIDSIRAFVNDRGGKVIKIHQSGFSEIGIPDLLVIMPSVGMFMVETKASGKKPTTIQLHRMDEIKKTGGWAFWCDSLEGFKEKLDERGYLI